MRHESPVIIPIIRRAAVFLDRGEPVHLCLECAAVVTPQLHATITQHQTVEAQPDEVEAALAGLPPILTACPKCNCARIGTLQRLTGISLLSFDEKGRPFYDGGTEVYWDGALTEKRDGGEVWICRSCAHEWVGPEVG